MHRTWTFAAVGMVAVGAAVWFCRPTATAEQNKPDPAPKATAKATEAVEAPVEPRPAPVVSTTQLPIGQVVLFSSGVGYFQREGTVEGSSRVDLSFPVTDINDLIKSMVLRDLDGGHISTVSYESNAPIERTLKSFAVNLTGNPSFGQILNQMRGEKVEVVLQQTNTTQPGTMTGTVVGIEHQRQQAGKDAVEVEVLNIWCADGVRSLKMTEIQRVRFLNPVMETEFRKALETLALSHDTQKKAVSINFEGKGTRNVRVGYVIENPIWKTSYRLVLDKQGKPYLQGWAVVENPTDEDWKDVRMSLVSGRPISFQMDLYQPLYVPRPTVEPELFASLRPPTYSGGIGGTGVAAAATTPAPVTALESLADKAPAASFGLAMPTNGSHALGVPPPADPRYREKAERQLNERMDLGRTGAGSAATASKLGDFFQYTIDRPVSLPRQKSALLPIVGKEVEASRVSIYNEATQAKFPLLGVKLKNTSGVHLNQGPITVFEGSNYAGDARILDLQPNEERLLSYAIDLGTEVNPVPSADDGKLTIVKAVKGIVYTTTKVRETKTYTITNRNDAERVVLIEHPVRNEFKLVDTDKPNETASDFYRFQVKVPAGKSDKQVVTEERTVQESLQITNLSDDNIRIFLNSKVTSPKVKQGLENAMKLRWAVAKTQRDIQEQQQQLNTITNDQVRLRENLRTMPSTAAAYKRYLEKFDLQETEIEKYQAGIKKLQATEHAQQKELEEFLANFNAE
jgi:hypothetical protein